MYERLKTIIPSKILKSNLSIFVGKSSFEGKHKTDITEIDKDLLANYFINQFSAT